MSTIATIISALLAVAFLGAGGTKLANVGPHEAEFERYGLPGVPAQTARVLVGMVEVIVAAIVVVAVFSDSSAVARVGAVVAVLTMLGALSTHVRLRDPVPAMAPAGVLGLLAVVVFIAA